MKLFTKEIDKQLFAQYNLGSSLENQKAVVKVFNPYGRGTWYIMNSDPSDPDYLWGIVKLFDVEVGSISRSELENLRIGPFQWKLERDTSFDPINAKELYKGLKEGKHFGKGGKIRKHDAYAEGGTTGKNFLFYATSAGDDEGFLYYFDSFKDAEKAMNAAIKKQGGLSKWQEKYQKWGVKKVSNSYASGGVFVGYNYSIGGL